jgi:hypothetical protein
LLLLAIAWWALNLSYEAFKLLVVGHCLVGFELELLKPSSLLLWAIAWWALNLSFEVCGIVPLKLVGLWA